MIIRYTICANDSKDVIKNFYKHIKYDNDLWINNKYINYDDYTELNKAMTNLQDFKKLFKKYLYNQDNITSDDRYALEFLLNCKFNYYLFQIGKEALINEGNVKIVNAVYDGSEDEKSVYYFVETEQIVIL